MKIMMFAHGGSLNRGCEAIVRSSTKIIKKKIENSRIYLASRKPETDKIIPNLDGIIDGSPQAISKYSIDWLRSSMRVKLFRDESFAYKKMEKNTIHHIQNMDVFLSIGGDNYCYGEQPALYEIDKSIKLKGKKLILWGCSVGEEDISERTLADLKLFDLILARETLTHQTLIDSGLENVKLVADPAFTMEKEELELPRGWQEGNTIGLNFSPLVSNMNKDSHLAVRDLIHHILTTTDMTIALTPHVTVKGNNDYEILSEFGNEFKDTGRVILLPDHLNAVQYKGYISRMRYFIGARTHATIAAYSSYVPTMVLGYSIKSKGISKDLFGQEKLVLGLEELSNRNKLISSFEEMVKDEKEIREMLHQSVPKIKEMSYKAVDYLTELL